MKLGRAQALFMTSLGVLAQELDPRDAAPPLKPLRDDAGPIIR